MGGIGNEQLSICDALCLKEPLALVQPLVDVFNEEGVTASSF